MKKILFFFILFLINNNLIADEKTHYIDIDFVLNNSNNGKLIVQKLQNLNDLNILELKKNEKELKDLENEISKVKNIISENELQKKVKTLRDKISLYRLEKDKKTNEFKSLKEKEIKIFFQKITPIINEFMKENSIAIILDKKNIFIANSKYDITDDIINILNKIN